jgi:hypothetical protein
LKQRHGRAFLSFEANERDILRVTSVLPFGHPCLCV